MATSNAIRVISLGLLAALPTHCLQAQKPAEETVSVPDVASPHEEGPAVERPKRPAELPPTPPKVSCQGNQLTIKAENSTMASVLAQVHACIGVEIDVPEGASESRTYLELGPGPTRQVLELLFNSTDFNYVIQSSNTNSDKIQAVVLMARTKDAGDPKTSVAANLTMTPARRAWLASRNGGRPLAIATEEEATHADEAAPVEAIAAERTATPPDEPKTPAGAVLAVESKDASKGISQDPLKDSSKDAANTSDPAAKAVATATQEPVSATATSEAAPAVAGPDSGQDSPAAKELQNKINDMQQLFEQRKKMLASPAQSPAPNQN